MENKTLLRQNLEIVINDYLKAFLKHMDWVAYEGYWVADDCMGIYAYGDSYFFNVADIVYCIDNNVGKDDMIKWHDYCVLAHEYGQTVPNLSSWVEGCSRASKSEMERIEKLVATLDAEVANLKSKY